MEGYFCFIILLNVLLMHLGNIGYCSFILYDLFHGFFIQLVINMEGNEVGRLYPQFLFSEPFLVIAK
jgi:hypothetical protein